VPDKTELSDVLSEFAHTMLTDFPIQGSLDRLLERMVDVLPITGAGVTLTPVFREPDVATGSAGPAPRSEGRPAGSEEVPRSSASESGEPTASPDLPAELRFPNYRSEATDEGATLVCTFPLHSGDTQVGALDLYRDSSEPLDEQQMAAAQTLADTPRRI
jgi:hypothetical protein